MVEFPQMVNSVWNDDTFYVSFLDCLHRVTYGVTEEWPMMSSFSNFLLTAPFHQDFQLPAHWFLKDPDQNQNINLCPPEPWSQVYINKNFQLKIVNISLPINFNICFGCSKECWLCSFVIFRGSGTILLRNPILFLWFFMGGQDPMSLPLEMPMIILPINFCPKMLFAFYACCIYLNALQMEASLLGLPRLHV